MHDLPVVGGILLELGKERGDIEGDAACHGSLSIWHPSETRSQGPAVLHSLPDRLGETSRR